MKYSFHMVRLQLLIIFPIIAFSLGFPLRASARSPNIEANPIAEQWILEQIANGRVADLAGHFEDENDRGISASFLEDLLAGDTDIAITRYGVGIRNATVIGAVSLESAEIEYDVRLVDCIFSNPVNLVNSHFHNRLSFNGSEFKSWARFDGMRVDVLLTINEAIFNGLVSFSGAKIENNFSSQNSKFNSELEANFNSMTVGGSIFLNGKDTYFAGPVDFGFVEIGKDFVADGAHFNSDLEANFKSMKLEGTLLLNNATFDGPVDFRFAYIGTNFDGDNADFNSEKGVSFNRVKSDGSFWLRGAIFKGPVDFGYTDININFEITKSQFLLNDKLVDSDADKDARKEINFFYAKIGGAFILESATFKRPVDFGYVEVGTVLSANETHFDSLLESSFFSMRVRESVLLHNAEFAGPVDFTYIDIGENFSLSDALFISEDEVKFNRMQVDGSVYLRRTTFAGPVDFGYADIGVNFEAQGTQFNTENHEVSSLFYNMSVGDKFIFGKSEFCEKDNSFFEKPDCADDEKIMGKYTMFYSGLSLGDSSFNQIIFNNVTWPPEGKTLSLGGMSYNTISIFRGDDRDAWQELISLANRSSFYAPTYTKLESYFKEQGHPERADKVYIAYKQRERKERLQWMSASWWWNIFLDMFVKYGRSPERAFAWSAIFVAIGLIVFKDVSKMIPSEKNLFPYHPLWYSFDLFLPFIDLGIAKLWNPKPERAIARNYRRIHMLLGWILIPIALLAITGVIK